MVFNLKIFRQIVLLGTKNLEWPLKYEMVKVV